MPDRVDGDSLRSGFLKYALATPDAPALFVGGKVRTYGDLDFNARRWAGAITSSLGRRPERIGIFAHRSETAYTGVLAALYAGATYVPLNPTFPSLKVAGMAARADIDAVIVDTMALPQVPVVFAPRSSHAIMAVPEADNSAVSYAGPVLGREALANAVAMPDLPPIATDDAAYLLFTSGSTGAPKGVAVTHGNARHFLDNMSRRYGIRPEDRFSQTFDLTFDLSVFDLFLAWNNGACVYASSPVDLVSPTRYINRHGLTVWFSVPSVPAQMLRRRQLRPDSLPTLRWSLFCGEPLPRRSAESWQDAAPNSIVENLYGPTELTIACFMYRWDRLRSPSSCRNEIVPIGRPVPGLMAVLLNEEGQPLAGNTGELCVAGPQTTPGYWQAPETTAGRYVDLPVSRHETRRFYRTGDLVSITADGDYQFLGRADHQIKILGHRIELGEIEAALCADVTVEHAVALGWPPPPMGAERIVAFVSGEIRQADLLRARVKESLPAYAVPQQVFIVDQMPLNSNGKIDRKTLAQWAHERLNGVAES